MPWSATFLPLGLTDPTDSRQNFGDRIRWGGLIGPQRKNVDLLRLHAGGLSDLADAATMASAWQR